MLCKAQATLKQISENPSNDPLLPPNQLHVPRYALSAKASHMITAHVLSTRAAKMLAAVLVRGDGGNELFPMTWLSVAWWQSFH